MENWKTCPAHAKLIPRSVSLLEDGMWFLLQEDRRAKRAFEKLAGKIEPGMMAKHFMRPEDNTVRTTDVPEREQQYRGPDPSNMDFQAMAL